MGANLTEQAVRRNVIAFTWHALLLSSAPKYDCICQVELKIPEARAEVFFLQTFPITAEISLHPLKWKKEKKKVSGLIYSILDPYFIIDLTWY